MADKNIRKAFEAEAETDAEVNEKYAAFKGSKVVKVVSIIGGTVSAFMFGWNFCNHNTTQMIIFGIMAVVCASYSVAKK